MKGKVRFQPASDRSLLVCFGQQITIGKGVGPEFEEPPRTIVGIVGDVRDGGLDQEAAQVMIVPLAQMPDGLTLLNSKVAPLVWIARTKIDPHQVWTKCPSSRFFCGRVVWESVVLWGISLLR